MLAVVDEIGDRRAPPHRDLGELVDAVEQDRFEVGLREHRRLRPARDAVADPAEADERATLGVLELVDLRRLDDLRTPLGDAAGLQDARRFMVVVHGPRQRIRLQVAFEHEHPATQLPEQDRQRGADRPVPHDRDVEGVAVVHVSPVPLTPVPV